MADIGAKDVSHHVAEVHQNPLRSGDAFDAERGLALTGERAVDMVRDGPDLTLRLAGAQNEIIGDGSQLGDMEDLNVVGLLFEGRLRYCKGLGLRLRYDRTPPDKADAGLYKIRPRQATTDLTEEADLAAGF